MESRREYSGLISVVSRDGKEEFVWRWRRLVDLRSLMEEDVFHAISSDERGVANPASTPGAILHVKACRGGCRGKISEDNYATNTPGRRGAAPATQRRGVSQLLPIRPLSGRLHNLGAGRGSQGPTPEEVCRPEVRWGDLSTSRAESFSRR
jgi:hypothetical protein